MAAIQSETHKYTIEVGYKADNGSETMDTVSYTINNARNPSSFGDLSDIQATLRGAAETLKGWGISNDGNYFSSDLTVTNASYTQSVVTTFIKDAENL